MTHHLLIVPIVVLHFLNAKGEPQEVRRPMPSAVCQTLAPMTLMNEILKEEHPDWSGITKWECTFDDGHKDL